MIKKTIKYTDYNDVERTDDFYFNLTKAEIMEMNFEADGGLDVYLTKITNTKDVKEIAKIFKTIILKSYGEKSIDGKRFVKNDEVRDAFEQSPAYTELYMELLSNADAAATFFKGIIPVELQQNTPMTIPTK